MVGIEGISWSLETFGEVGPHIHAMAPRVLAATHSLYAANQVALGLSSADPYGLMWLGVPKALVDEFKDIAGVQRHRPRYGRYHVPVINGVPLVPWRYAKDRVTDIDVTPFGHPLTQSKKSLFERPDLRLELPLGEHGFGEALLAELSPEQRQDVNQFSESIRALVREYPRVAVLAYASNPEALLRCFLGYASLGENGLLDWTFREELEAVPTGRPSPLVALTPDARPAFDDGVPETPVLRPRSPWAPAPTPEPPATPGKSGSGE